MELRPHHSPDDNRQRPESGTTTTARKAKRASDPIGGPDEAIEAVLARARHQMLDQSAPSASADVERWFAVGGPRVERTTVELCDLAPRRRRPVGALRVVVIVAAAAAVVIGVLASGPGDRVVATPSSAPAGSVDAPSSAPAPMVLADGTLILVGPAGDRWADAAGSGSTELPGTAEVTGDQTGAEEAASASVPSAPGTATDTGTRRGSATTVRPAPPTRSDVAAGSSSGPVPAPPAAAGETSLRPDAKVQIDYWFAVHRYNLCLQRRALATPETARPCRLTIPAPTVLRPYVEAVGRHGACIARWEPVVGAVRARNRCGASPDAAQFGVVADPFGPRSAGPDGP